MRRGNAAALLLSAALTIALAAAEHASADASEPAHSAASSTARVAGKKYNVLYLVADDMRSELGYLGAPAVTPNLDSLAKKSLAFAQVPAGVAAPLSLHVDTVSLNPRRGPESRRSRVRRTHGSLMRVTDGP